MPRPRPRTFDVPVADLPGVANLLVWFQENHQISPKDLFGRAGFADGISNFDLDRWETGWGRLPVSKGEAERFQRIVAVVRKELNDMGKATVLDYDKVRKVFIVSAVRPPSKKFARSVVAEYIDDAGETVVSDPVDEAWEGAFARMADDVENAWQQAFARKEGSRVATVKIAEWVDQLAVLANEAVRNYAAHGMTEQQGRKTAERIVSVIERIASAKMCAQCNDCGEKFSAMFKTNEMSCASCGSFDTEVC